MDKKANYNTLSVYRAFTVLSHPDLATPQGVDAFIEAVLVLCPEMKRKTLIEMPIDELLTLLQARTKEAVDALTQTNEQWQALQQVKSIWGVD